MIVCVVDSTFSRRVKKDIVDVERLVKGFKGKGR